MKTRRLGIDSKCYYNSAWAWATRTGWDAPTWGVADLFEDFTMGGSWNVAPAGDRNQGVDAGAKTRVKLPVAGRMRVDDTDASYQAFLTAFLNREATLDLLVLNGPMNDDGAVGFRALFIVSDFAEDQGADMVLYRAFSGQPAPASLATPVMSVVVTGGVPVYTPSFIPPG
jgi:hypothetical protein